jgi:3-methylcrotonyl-CoA carboxylase alpha subunit
MFNKILIANRGEIACRIIRTARHMGVATVAVYSDADRDSKAVEMADEAIHIGPAPAGMSYLLPSKILEAAKRCGAQAIHPGYGFLSENANFARACSEADIAFIGPPASAIEAMGSKSGAKALMEAAGVPVVPGYHGDAQDDATLHDASIQTGFPLLVKASAGGGGKGMRIVHGVDELDAAIAGARREAEASFGDGKLLLERFVQTPRHVEVQVFFDAHGNGVHLGERDCSVQRRYQKVLEEAPAPHLSTAVKERMYEAALNAARAVSYEGAGTVEFIVGADGEFFFMEMNTRLQVEHPVTEMIHDVDLVEWQLRASAGEQLPKTQSELTIRGASVEARLYAEDPANGFLPATGSLEELTFPDQSDALRIDTGVRTGDDIGVHYDPMVAKVIAWGPTREEAVTRLAAALASTRIKGLTTNCAFLVRALRSPEFMAGGVDTGFLERSGEALTTNRDATSEEFILGALAIVAARNETLAVRGTQSVEPDSPWNDTTGWWPNLSRMEKILLSSGDEVAEVHLARADTGFTVSVGEQTVQASCSLNADLLSVELDGHKHTVEIITETNGVQLLLNDGALRVQHHDPLAVAAAEQGDEGHLRAPMPGTIISCHVAPGDAVEAGQALMVLEAMKMEHTIAANAPGTVSEVRFRVGELVDEGVELIVVDTAER